MTRYGVSLATFVLALSIAASSAASAAPKRGGGGGGGAPHAAPAFHATPRISAPRMSAPRISAPRMVSRPSGSAFRHAAPMRRFAAPQRRATTHFAIRRATTTTRSAHRFDPRLRQQTVQRPTKGIASQQAAQRLQQLRSKGSHLGHNDRRELRRLERAQHQQQLNPQAAQTQTALRRNGRAPITAQQAVNGRFASSFARGNSPRNERRAARLVARAAWRLGLAAAYVPWLGPVYWPYAYDDIFYYAFWPDAYDPGYWAYAYDDLFDGVFFPYGAPYIDTASEGPYGPYSGAPETTGSAPTARQAIPGRLTVSQRAFCTDQANSATVWPIDQIERAVQPNDEQRQLLLKVKQAAVDAAARFRQACPNVVPMTPPGRLQAMTLRLRATLDAVKTVRPPLTAFYESLNDEQKARFNELGPDLGRTPQRKAAEQSDCSGDKAGLSGLATERIEAAVRPNAEQRAALDRLEEAMKEAVDTLQKACPATIALTPVGRLETMQQRLEAMLAAADVVRPALSDFYAALSDEQKAKFNRLGRQSASNE